MYKRIFSSLLLTSCISTTMLGCADNKASVTGEENAAVAKPVNKISDISFKDFQAYGCNLNRLEDNKLQIKLGDKGCTLILATEKLAQFTSEQWMSFDRHTDGNSAVGTSMLFWSKGNKGHRPDLTIADGLFPELPSRRAIPLTLLKEGRGTPKTPGALIAFAFGSGVHLDEWSRFAISINNFYGGPERTITLENFQFVDAEPDYPVGDQKIVDEIGQWKQAKFKDKFDGYQEMESYLRQEASITVPERENETFSHYGGIKSKQFKATGFFRTEFADDRWFLVDPLGYAFYSVGIDIIGPGVAGNVDGIKKTT